MRGAIRVTRDTRGEERLPQMVWLEDRLLRILLRPHPGPAQSWLSDFPDWRTSEPPQPLSSPRQSLSSPVGPEGPTCLEGT